MVELDYGGLANYLDLALRRQGFAGISDDSSIEDVAHSLKGLAANDGAVAGEGYERLVSRWRLVQSYESALHRTFFALLTLDGEGGGDHFLIYTNP